MSHFGDKEFQAALRRELTRLGPDGAFPNTLSASDDVMPDDLLAALRAMPDGGGTGAFEAVLRAVVAERRLT